MVPYANVVLLPAGTINLQETWILPADTRIIGEGSALTTIQPCTTTVCGGQAFSGPDMIDMGSSAICLGSNCQAVLIEHLGLNGGNVDGTNGIVNSSSQELSYVSDVSFTNIPGTALAVETINAVNSGPYSKLTMSNVGTCVNLNNTYGTRGIHGLTCAPATSSTAGVLVDGGNNTIEDVSISGTTSQDGILVGANLAAPNNVLFNVHGSTLKNVVHISALSTDTSVLGVTNLSGINTIEDDLTSPQTLLTDPTLAMYIVGEQVFSGVVTRFTTSPSFPTWLVGPNPGTSSCSIGSLYSATSGTSGTLFGCRGSSGTGSWHMIN